jgi:ubiquinone/menaquinone biosynthesis C-methylase UbiE
MGRHPGAGTGEGLPAPAVSADVYDEEYYRHVSAGASEWHGSGGAEPAGIYVGALMRARMGAGEVVVDIGAGRGELVAVALQQGAALAVGLEYAAAAIGLFRRTMEVHGVRERGAVVMADARAIPLADDAADLVTMLDVVEHLTPPELDRVLQEARRVLRPGGRLFAHTMPNRTIYNVTYRLQRLGRPSRWFGWPRDPRNDYERRMHVNEQTLWSLRRSLRRAGFRHVDVELGGMVYRDFVPDPRARSLYARLARHRLTAALGVGNIFAEATK